MKNFLLLAVCFIFISESKSQENNSDYIEGIHAMREGQYEIASDFFMRALDKDSLDFPSYHLLSHCWIKLNMFREADSLLWIVNLMDTNNSGTYYYQGMLAQARKNDSATIASYKKYLKKSLKQNDPKPFAWMYIGAAYSRMLRSKGLSGYQVADMVFHYQRYMKLNPEDPNNIAINEFLANVKSKQPSDPATVWVYAE